MLPLLLPEVIIAISLLVVLLQLGFDLSLFSVTLGHILMAVPFSIAVLSSSFEGFDRSLEEASLDLGEGPAATFFRVTLPIIAPGILSSLLITFTISLDEFIVAFRSEEHTSELQSLMRTSYAVFCLKKKKILSWFSCVFSIAPTHQHRIRTRTSHIS